MRHGTQDKTGEEGRTRKKYINDSQTRPGMNKTQGLVRRKTGIPNARGTNRGGGDRQSEIEK